MAMWQATQRRWPIRRGIIVLVASVVAVRAVAVAAAAVAVAVEVTRLLEGETIFASTTQTDLNAKAAVAVVAVVGAVAERMPVVTAVLVTLASVTALDCATRSCVISRTLRLKRY